MHCKNLIVKWYSHWRNIIAVGYINTLMITFDRISRIELEEATEFLFHRLNFINSVDLVIQLGSGQSPENILDHEWDRIPLRDMPHLPAEESLAKHTLEILWGTVDQYKVMIYSGRFHYYEGFGILPCILPIWAAVECGARNFFFANAAVSLSDRFKPGEFMVFNDHINNIGVSPLTGHQHLLKSSYVDMSQTYSRDLSNSFVKSAQSENLTIKDGIYMANQGPQFETPAEIKVAQLLGADALGMSTVLEAITAHALNTRVVGVSMIKHSAAERHGDGKISHQKAFDVGKQGNKQLVKSLRRWLANEANTVL